MQNNIAIIPARGGSTRLPGKNCKEINGKPMIVWTIEAAQKSQVFDEIFVSTDCEQIASVVEGAGIKVPFLRDKKDADNHTPVATATLNALLKFEEYKKCQYKTVTQLMANCPCRTAEDIKAAYEMYKSTQTNFQISAFKYGWINPHWAMKMEENNRVSQLFPEAFKKRAQDLNKLYCPTGAIWIADTEKFKKEKTFYGPEFTVCPMSWQSACDIDIKEDFEMAETIFNLRALKKKEALV